MLNWQRWQWIEISETQISLQYHEYDTVCLDRVDIMDELKSFIQTYLSEMRNFIGQFPRVYWTIFPDFFYRPYIIRARTCSNGVAILVKRPAPQESINVKNSKKRNKHAKSRVRGKVPEYAEKVY